MSIQWADSFSRYGFAEANMLNGLYASAAGTLTNTPDPDDTGVVFRITEAGQGEGVTLRKVLSSAQTTVGSACRLWMTQLPPDEDRSYIPMAFSDSVNANTIMLQIRPSGTIAIRSTSATAGDSLGTIIGETTVPVITANAFTHLEWKVVRSDTVGTVELRVNGVTRLELTGVNTREEAVLNFLTMKDNSFASAQPGSGYIKDLVIWDDQGTENNDFMGSVKVGRLKPTADVTLGGWVPSTGTTGFDLLAKDAVDDATYLSADDSPPSPMQFNFESLPADVVSVRGIIAVARMRKVDGGDATVQTSLSPDGVDWDDGADRPITTAFTYWYDVSEVSPDTTDPWTPIEVNNITGEVNRTL